MTSSKIRECERMIEEMRLALVREWAKENDLDISQTDDRDLMGIYNLMLFKASKRKEI